MEFNNTDKNVLNQFLETVGTSKLNAISTMDKFWALTNPKTRELIDRILALNPSDYGFRGDFVPQESVPNNMIELTTPPSNQSGEYKLGGNPYLPSVVHGAFSDMAEGFKKDFPNRRLMVGSGYRSSAFQILTLLYILTKVYDFDLSKTLKRVAMPQYSQHCSASNTAIDILNLDGEPSDEKPESFKDSIEYMWLVEHAHKYSFYESYPVHNSDGIMPEPWHWQYIA